MAYFHRSLCCSLSLLLILLTAHATVFSQDVVEDSSLGFTLELPEGFSEPQSRAGLPPEIRYVFTYSEDDGSDPEILLFIEKLRGTIGQEPMTAEYLPKGVDTELSRNRWHNYEVDTVRVRENIEGQSVLTFNTQVPLKKAAIQLRLFGPESREPELKALIPEILNGLQGASNWDTDSGSSTPSGPGRSSRTGGPDAYGFTLLAIGLTGIVFGLIVYGLVGYFAPRGALLGLAGFIYAVGFAAATMPTREALMFGGCMKLLGFIGIIWGIVSLAVKRKPQNQQSRY